MTSQTVSFGQDEKLNIKPVQFFPVRMCKKRLERKYQKMAARFEKAENKMRIELNN